MKGEKWRDPRMAEDGIGRGTRGEEGSTYRAEDPAVKATTEPAAPSSTRARIATRVSDPR
jgi:hypothetical protein